MLNGRKRSKEGLEELLFPICVKLLVLVLINLGNLKHVSKPIYRTLWLP